MLFGADYYPEHWDKTEWKQHAALMKKGNFNVVRVAEFAWCRLEPQEDQYDFSWLDEAIGILAQEGVKVILGTPTAAPPKWLVNQYDIYQRDKYGRIKGYGSRRECCANNDDYVARSKKIVEKMAEHYGKNENVIGWQIDNEFGCHNSTRCYCEQCKRKFSKWLEKKYHGIDVLNRTYGTVFWSQEYADFEDVILPAYTSCEGTYGDAQAHNPSLEMDFYRFSSDSWIRFEQMQIEVIRQYSKAPITHNLMGHFTDIDYYKLGALLDVAAWDNYVSDQWGTNAYEKVSMAHEMMHGIKDKNFWVMEQQAGPCGWDKFGASPRPGQLRLWAYQAVAHGCEGIVYFRFKSANFGMEQYWLGLVDHDGVPRRRFDEVSRTGAELQSLSDLIVGSESKTDVFFVKSYENVWCHRIKRHVENFDYEDVVYTYYKSNLHLGTNPACGSKERINDSYKIVYMPAYAMVSEETKEQLEKYVRNGGTLVLTYRSGIKDVNNNMTTLTLPGYLRELAGVTVEEFDTSPDGTKLSDGFGAAHVWCDILSVDTAEVKVKYESGYYAGGAAVTVNRYGKGSVWYVACDLEEAAADKLVKMITDESGAAYLPHPAGTEVVKRSRDGKEYLILLNYTDSEQYLDYTGVSCISKETFDGRIEPYGVEVCRDFYSRGQ